MGGPPSQGTPADKRLKENRPGASRPTAKPASDDGPKPLPSGFSDKPWDGSASRWSDAAAYADACLINTNSGPRGQWTKDAASLPVKEPGGDTVNVNAMAAAAAALAGGRGGVSAPAAAKKSAAKKLAGLYNRAGRPVPPSIRQMAM